MKNGHFLKKWIKKQTFTASLFKCLEKYLHVYWLSIPAGHFYSPVPNASDIEKEIQKAASQDDLLDIPWSGSCAESLFKSLYELWTDFETDMIKNPSKRYRFENVYFSGMDAFILYAMLRTKKPARVFEIGSGYSSALILDVIEKYYGRNEAFRLVCIEPFPQRLKEQTGQDSGGLLDIKECTVQEISADFFMELQPGDFLFVDSSHVAKAGSDINHIFFEILPRLAQGVWIHFHDIFWPFTYPENWFAQGRFWNEAYFLRAFLQNNDKFSMRLSNHYIVKKYDSESQLQTLPQLIWNDASSIWIEKNK